MLLGDAPWEQQGVMVWCGDLHTALDGGFSTSSLHKYADILAHVREFAYDIIIAHQMLKSAARVMWWKLSVRVVDGMFMRSVYGNDVAGRSRDARLPDLHWLMRKLHIARVQMKRKLQVRENLERNAMKQIERVLEKLML